MTPLRLATRGSDLALHQADRARAALERAAPGVEVSIIAMATAGDELVDVSLEGLEGRGFFTDALEAAIGAGRADAAVHSLKDVPVELPGGFEIAAVLERGDVRDAIVSPHGGIDALPDGAIVGTDSSRRRRQLALRRPDLRFRSLRGNVPTRLAKLDRGEYDAIVVARAALDRLSLAARASETLPPAVCLPAPGQGAICMEARSGSDAAAAIRTTDHPATRTAVLAERAFLAALGGGCAAPIGAWGRIENGALLLSGVVFDGDSMFTVEIDADPAAPEAAGRSAASRIRSRS